ncbi:MAG: GxxExxY protein [Candidatus Cloacimonas sp.]|jgi:GxxExxY protein|nr:GxxExxY protein [Candidatus Cloacimonas sp.]
MMINDVTYKVRGAIYSVINELGPGLLESVYEAALKVELEALGLKVELQVPVHVLYKGTDLGLGFRLDLLVEDMLIIELKSVESIQNVHLKQLLTYLKLTGKPVGLLVNFNTSDINANIKRLVNGKIDNI